MTIYVSDQLQATAAAVSGVPTPDTSWQWLRNGAPISGATSSVYYATADDLGTSISVVQSAINMLGTATATSAADGPVLPFLPSLLFRNAATKGVWYDPSDTTTLFQDAAGTTPVTAVEQPVGLMLDKSKGLVLGPELVTNGDFSNGTTGWAINTNGTATVSSGVLTLTNGSVGFQRIAQGLATTVGKTYRINCTNLSGNSRYSVSSANDYGQNVLAVQSVSGAVFTATTTTSYIVLSCYTANNGDTATFDNISVRELPGNHAFNSSGNSANFPVLSARYNLLTKSEQFDDVVWTKSSCAITPNATTAPDGTLTADRAVFTAGGLLYANGLPTTAGTYIFSGYVKSATGSAQTMRIFGNGTLSYSGNLPVTTEWTWVSFTFTYSAATSGFATSSGQPLDIYIWGADLRVANDGVNLPAYQRVNTATDYDTVGFKPYLRFNGTNQWLQTNSIDFTYGGKMFVSAGVRKLSDAVQTVYELSANYASNSGSLSSFINGGGASTNTIDAGLKGSGVNTYFSSSSYGTPISYVHSVSHNIAGTNRAEEIIPRINGVLNQSGGGGATDTGGGMFGNYPLYIGSRAGTSVWFNGRLYQLVVAGKQASAAEITSTEAYINQKTGAY